MSNSEFKVSDTEILQIFGNSDKIDTDSYSWYRSILEKLAVFGHNNAVNNWILTQEIQASNRDIRFRAASKPSVYYDNYAILEVDGLFAKAAVELVPSYDDWTHPAVLYILKNLKKLKTLVSEDTVYDKAIWIKLKLFTNMTPGILNYGYFASQDGDLLRILVHDPLKAINRKASEIMDSIIFDLGMQNNVAARETDRVLFDVLKVSYTLRDSKYIDDIAILRNSRKLFDITSRFQIRIIGRETEDELIQLKLMQPQ